MENLKDEKNNLPMIDISAFAIVDCENIAKAMEMIAIVKKEIKELDKKRQEMTKPINESLRKINAHYKAYIEPMQSFLSDLEKKVSSFHVEQKKIELEAEIERRKIEADLLTKERDAWLDQSEKTGDVRALEMAVMAENQLTAIENSDVQKYKQRVHTGDMSISTISRWTYDIVNESLVPRQYCIPSPALINRAVLNGVRDIDGVNIFEKISTRVN